MLCVFSSYLLWRQDIFCKSPFLQIKTITIAWHCLLCNQYMLKLTRDARKIHDVRDRSVVLGWVQRLTAYAGIHRNLRVIPISTGRNSSFNTHRGRILHTESGGAIRRNIVPAT